MRRDVFFYLSFLHERAREVAPLKRYVEASRTRFVHDIESIFRA
jgi:hypothetical protein